MKKILITMCAALFVAAMVLPALAADMSISGFYRVRGIYQSHADDGAVTPFDDEDDSQAWWDHILVIDPVFKVTDNLRLVTRVSMFNNQIWGSNQTSGAVPTTGALSVNGYGDEADNILMNGAYIDWNTEVGRVKIGRMPGFDTYFTPWANTTLDADRLMYFSPDWNGFSFYAFTEKQAENDAIIADTSDQDTDRYGVLLQYATPVFYIGYALDYYDQGNPTENLEWYRHTASFKTATPGNALFAEIEAALEMGDYTDDADREGWGVYANIGTKMGPATLGAAFAYSTGDSDADGDYEVGPASGLDFQPLYILYSPWGGILNSTNTALKAGYSNEAAFADPGDSATGSLAAWLYADYAVNPQLAVHGAIAYAKADEIDDDVYEDDEIGYEVDLGMKYQIMNNLAYELHFGYLFAGDIFDSAGNEADDVYQLDHSLTLSF